MIDLRQNTIVTVPATGAAVSLAQARRQVKIEDSDTSKDAELADMIAAAQSHVEEELGYPVILQTRQTHLRGFPSGPIWIGAGYDLTVDQVQYYDSNGVLQTMNEADYIVDAVSRPAMIYPAVNTSWPSTQCRPGAVQITWTAGWTDSTDIPAGLSRAMLLLIGHWDQNRENVVVGTISNEVDMTMRSLIRPYRIDMI